MNDVTKPEGTQDPVGVSFDTLLLPNQQLRVHAVILRHGQKSYLDFQISLTAFNPEDQERLEQLQYWLARWDQADPVRVVSRLLGIALEQQGMLDKEERDKRVNELLLVGLKPEVRPEQSRKYSSAELLGGISPLLQAIPRRIRNRLWRRHGIDVDELQRESSQLYREVEHYWETIPPESVPSTEAFFTYTAQQFDLRVLAHHQKVFRVGQLLGKDLGKAMCTLADRTIKNIRA
jgi:hypothetical protein